MILLKETIRGGRYENKAMRGWRRRMTKALVGSVGSTLLTPPYLSDEKLKL